MSRTLKELAKEAIEVQDACNLSGVVHGWSRAMSELFELLKDGTESKNTHPINQLWASKCHDLARMGTSEWEAYHEAYSKCKELADG